VPEIGYTVAVVSGVCVVAVPAEIDVTTTEHLDAVLLGAIRDGHPAVVVDMTGTRFCDSSGIHTLLRAHKRAVAEGAELRLVVPAGGAVRRVFDLFGLDLLVPCFSGLPEALAQPTAAGRQRTRQG
jgi:anti-sigma B factor antagonist